MSREARSARTGFESPANHVEVNQVESKIEDLISRLDTNGDGKIDYTEFAENYCKLENSKFFDE